MGSGTGDAGAAAGVILVELPSIRVLFNHRISFNSLAPHYRTIEAILAGPILQRCRVAFLPQVANCRRALPLGEGPVRFLVELLTANARIEVVCVEQSPRMIEESRRALRQRGIDHRRVQFVQMDALEWRPAVESFDLVATHFFLDCFRREEFEQLISTVAKGVKDDAIWLISDFPKCHRGALNFGQPENVIRNRITALVSYA